MIKVNKNSKEFIVTKIGERLIVRMHKNSICKARIVSNNKQPNNWNSLEWLIDKLIGMHAVNLVFQIVNSIQR